MKPSTILTDQPLHRASLPVDLSGAQSKRWWIFLVCFISTLFGGVSSMLMSVYLPVVARDLLGTAGEEKLNAVGAAINALFILGWMFGGMTWGFIGDRAGRARSVVLSTATYALFTLMTAWSPSWMLVSISRFMAGFGIGGVLVTTTILVTEYYPAKKRAVALGMLSVAIPLGFFVAGAVNNLVSDWHKAFLLGVVPLVLSLVALFTLSEPAEWKKAGMRLQYEQRDRSSLFDSVYRRDLFDGSLIFGSMLIGLWAIFSWAPTWAQGLAVPSGAQQSRGLTLMILALGGLGGSFFSGWIVNAIGLKRTMMLCFSVCFLLSFTIFRLSVSLKMPVYIELAILAFFFGISQGALALYIPLLFPTEVKAAATGFCFNVGRLFTGTVVFFIGALVFWLGGYGHAIFIFSFVFLIGLAATWRTRLSEEVPMANT